MAEQYVNTFVDTTVPGGITDVALQITLADDTYFPAGPDFAIVVWQTVGGVTTIEEMKVTAGGDGIAFPWTVARAQGGTVARAFAAGAYCSHSLTARSLAQIIADHAGLPNAHHAQAHAIGGADHSGTLDHGALGDLGADDHTIYSLASGTRPFVGVVDGVEPTDIHHLATKGYVDALVQTEIAVADHSVLTKGTEGATTYADTQHHTGAAWTIQEVNTGIGIDVELHFAAIAGIPSHFWLRAYYAGSAGHHVHVECWNFVGSVWEDYMTLSNATAYSFYDVPLPDGAEHVSAGEARIRFRHDGGAVPSHYLYVDYCAIVKSGLGGGGASALDDLTDVNAPAPNDNDVLTWDAVAGEWIAQAPPAGGAVDADDVTYTPTTVADWDGSADPGSTMDALDQLAERTKDLEGAAAGAIATDTLWDAKGDLAVGTGSDTASRLAVGTDGKVLTAASGEATGLIWAAASGGASILEGQVFS
jgi:hypothetical protein